MRQAARRTMLYTMAAAVAAGAVLFAGCAKNQALRETTGERIISKTENGVRATMIFLPRSELITRYGKRNNPYIAPKTVTTPGEFLVFQLRVDEAGGGGFSNLIVNLNAIELHFGGKVENPTNQFHFLGVWQQLIREKEGEYDEATIDMKIKRTLLENQTAANGGPISGLLLFRKKLPSYGEANITVPVFDQNGKLVHRFEFDFQF